MCLTTSQVTLVSVATPVAVISSPTGVQAASSGPSRKARTNGRKKEAARTVGSEIRGATIGRADAAASSDDGRRSYRRPARASVKIAAERTPRGNTLFSPFQGVQSATPGAFRRGRIKSAGSRSGPSLTMLPTPLGRHAGTFVLSLLLALAAPAREAAAASPAPVAAKNGMVVSAQHLATRGRRRRAEEGRQRHRCRGRGRLCARGRLSRRPATSAAAAS